MSDAITQMHAARRTRSSLVPMLSEMEIRKAEAVAMLAAARYRDEGDDCGMGVGCREACVCYAEAHGEPERCPRVASSDYDDFDCRR